MSRRNVVWLSIFALSALAYLPFAQWITTTPVGTIGFVFVGGLLYGFALIAGMVATPALIVGLFFRRRRRESFLLLMLFVLFTACVVGGIILGKQVRMAGMRSFVERSEPLVESIHKYELDHSTPPQSLEDLVPDYIPVVPSTGMMAYPEYRYHTSDEAKQEYANNFWALSVFTPNGGINFDRILYFPNQEYPEIGYGGRLERIGDWAYVHE